ncbi:hypothetical protein [Roseateles sp.]|uniref:hypothetical protein n=1 Tax=Roseateles sp. TaxID=1971397 RepID=UPI0025FDD93B|nr:hypothetical protein [Roseateles sp.]MBV8035998.1 hypothetical protein [Roseateles sp.]
MTHPRWTLLLAALAGTAGVVYTLHEPAERAPAADPAPGVAALPLPTPLQVSAAGTVAQPWPAAGPLAGRPAPAAPPPRIGSEGYGPHIERAQANGDAAAAWEAVQWLRQCASNEERRQSYELARGERIPQEMLTQLMLEADAEGRLCQTVTARHRAMLPDLALRAIRGEVPHAAVAFATLVSPGDIAPALRQEVADALRRDANAGRPESLLGASTDGAAWGLSDEERLGYLVAFSEMDGNGGQALVRQWIAQRTIRLKAEPTAQQLSAAQVAGQQIVGRARAGKPP